MSKKENLFSAIGTHTQQFGTIQFTEEINIYFDISQDFIRHLAFLRSYNILSP